MTTTLVTGIAELVTNDPQHARAGASEDERLLGLLTDAAIVVEDDRIAWVGEARRAPERYQDPS